MVQPSYTVNTRDNYTLGGGDLYATSAMIALADWGEVGVVKEFSSITELKEFYKSGVMFEAARRFFDGGGRLLSAVRIAGTTKAKASKTLLSTATPVITLTGKYDGTFGNSISVAVLANGSNMDVYIYYGTKVEKFLNLATNTDIVNAINASGTGSAVVTATLVAATPFVTAATQANLAGGANGTNISSSDYTTVLDTSLITKEWDYLVTPEQTSDNFHATMGSYMATRAVQEHKYSTYVGGVTKFEDISVTTARTATDSEGNIVVVHTSFFTGNAADDKSDTNKWLDATYSAACYAGRLCSLPVNDSPTFKSIAMIGGKSLAENDYTDSERESLISRGFTVVGKTFTDVYGVIMGVTRAGSSGTWSFQLDSKRKVDYIKENVYNISKGYFGQVNDGITRQAIKSSINAFMNDITKDRIIEDAEVEVLKGSDPRSVIINVSLLLISEVDYITFNLTLNV
jgi:hypothetical protein